MPGLVGNQARSLSSTHPGGVCQHNPLSWLMCSVVMLFLPKPWAGLWNVLHIFPCSCSESCPLWTEYLWKQESAFSKQANYFGCPIKDKLNGPDFQKVLKHGSQDVLRHLSLDFQNQSSFLKIIVQIYISLWPEGLKKPSPQYGFSRHSQNLCETSWRLSLV